MCTAAAESGTLGCPVGGPIACGRPGSRAWPGSWLLSRLRNLPGTCWELRGVRRENAPLEGPAAALGMQQ